MKSTRALLFTVPALVLAMIAGSFSLALSKSGPPAPQDMLAQALKLAGQQPSFHMVADMQQTVMPRAIPGNGGKRDETTTLRVVGDLARQMGLDGTTEPRARLQFYAGTDSPVEFILAGTKTYVGYDSRWQEVDALPGSVAPGGDYLGYLVAATDVTADVLTASAAGAITLDTSIVTLNAATASLGAIDIDETDDIVPVHHLAVVIGKAGASACCFGMIGKKRGNFF